MNDRSVALVTGITGFVGSHLAEYLIENTDWEIVGLSRWRSPLDNLESLVSRIERGDRIRLVYGDLRDSVSLNRAIESSRPDFVFHLAAQSYPLTSFSAPIETLDTNILGTQRLLEAIRCHTPNAVVHVCSSSEVFGRVPKELVPIKESTSFHPASPYAISKAGTDLIGRFFAEAYKMKIVTTRMFTHTGPRRGDVFAESSFAKQIALIENEYIEPVIKVGNLDSLRTFADVRDAVRAYFFLVTKDPTPGESYNIGGSHTCTIGEMLDFLISMSTRRSEIKIEVDPSRLRPIDADLQIPDTSKFMLHTGWKPEIRFEQTMTDLLAYWRTKVKNRGFSFLSR